MLPTMTNPGAERVRRIRALTTAPGRRRHSSFIVEGPQGVREAVNHAPNLVKDLYLSIEASQQHTDILDAATGAGLYLHLCSPEVIEAMSSDAQGVVAVLSSQPHHATDFGASGVAGGRFFVGLIEARDPGNTGAIIRAADAAGAAGVIMSAGSVSVENPKVLRASAGSSFHLPITTGATAAALIAEAMAAGVQVLATTAAGTHMLDDLSAGPIDLAKPTLWLFGNEAHGLPADVLDRADHSVAIPIYGQAESLNLAMAATLCLYASARACAARHTR